MAWPEMLESDLETFYSLDPETRALVLRLLGGDPDNPKPPTDADHQALNDHPNGAMLASWLLKLPAYECVNEVEED